MNASSTMRAVSWTAVLCVAGRHAAGNWQLARTLAWLARRGRDPADGEAPHVHVVMPVLREQRHVNDALDWWREILPLFPGMTLTIVSTAREERERDAASVTATQGQRPQKELPARGRPTYPMIASRAWHRGLVTPGSCATSADSSMAPLTREVVEQALRSADQPRIRHITYPGQARKAGQVNYAGRTLPATGYLAVYDVDSRPGVEVIRRTRAELTGPAAPPVAQHHALHRAAAGQTGVAAALVRGSAELQTIWTLRREIPYARRYQKWAGQRGLPAWLRGGLPQPVGHGLYVRQDALAAIGGLPEATVLDDVPAGIPLALAGLRTMSIPHLTEVPAPETVSEVVAQHRRWFCSYLDYPAILQAAARAGLGQPAQRRVLGFIAAYRGTAWLAATPLTAATVAAAISPGSSPGLRSAAWAALALAAVLPAGLTAALNGDRILCFRTATISADLLAAYMLRSAGPWLAVADAARGRHPTSPASPSPKAARGHGGPR